MEAKITVITIGVDDLERSLRFYRDGLRFSKRKAIIGKEFEVWSVAFFDLPSGLQLAIWPRKSISRDTGIPLSGPSATELTLGITSHPGRKSMRLWNKRKEQAPLS